MKKEEKLTMTIERLEKVKEKMNSNITGGDEEVFTWGDFPSAKRVLRWLHESLGFRDATMRDARNVSAYIGGIPREDIDLVVEDKASHNPREITRWLIKDDYLIPMEKGPGSKERDRHVGFCLEGLKTSGDIEHVLDHVAAKSWTTPEDVRAACLLLSDHILIRLRREYFKIKRLRGDIVLPGKTRKCIKCKTVRQETAFISKTTGRVTEHCAKCRLAWSREQRRARSSSP